MLQRLQIAFAQVKTGNSSENSPNYINLIKSDKLYILYIEQKKSLKKYVTI